MFDIFPEKSPIPGSEIEGIQRAISLTLESAPKPDHIPPLLFHYTDSHGLRGIIEGGKLRGTHVAFMNDASEYIHAVLLFRSIVRQRVETETHPLKKDALSDLAASPQSDSAVTYPPLFITCFSAAENSLNQWRAYSRGEGGFSLGFGINQIQQLAIQAKASLWPVIYDQAAQQAFISTLLDAGLTEYARVAATYTPAQRAQHRADWLQMFTLLASALAPLLKNSSFSEEQEWRIVYTLRHMKELKFLSKPSTLSTFVELDLATENSTVPNPPVDHLGQSYRFPKRLPVEKLWMGPGYMGHQSTIAAKALLEMNGYFNVKLELSAIPFRVG